MSGEQTGGKEMSESVSDTRKVFDVKNVMKFYLHENGETFLVSRLKF